MLSSLTNIERSLDCSLGKVAQASVVLVVVVVVFDDDDAYFGAGVAFVEAIDCKRRRTMMLLLERNRAAPNSKSDNDQP